MNNNKNGKSNQNLEENASKSKKDIRTLKRKVGDLGESIAARFLMKQGYQIKDKNYLKKFGELDIIAKKADIVHFIEVKTVTKRPPSFVRSSDTEVIHETMRDDYRPEDNVHAWKMKRLGHTIEAYVLEKRLGDMPWQFDVITVYIVKSENKAYLHVLENVIL